MMTTDSYFIDYHLPENLIAQTPSKAREQSRLLRVDRASRTLSHGVFSDVFDMLSSKDVLVFNNTKVIPAKLKAKKPSGAAIECLLVESITENEWFALMKPNKRLKNGDILDVGKNMSIEILEKAAQGIMNRVLLHTKGKVFDALACYGELPLPPYIKNKKDAQRYQTVYAKEPGAIAAPTAGLHFSELLLEKLRKKGVKTVEITLHVGYGTFKSIEGPVEDHKMHSESYFISEEAAETLSELKGQNNIIAVGTTAARTLESAIEGSQFKSGWGKTCLYIKPGYEFQALDGLITNFHLPKSTLLLLVSAFAGTSLTQSAYEEAIRESYRFYSFGDAMIIR